jgi:hypothetical protein
VPPGDQCSCSLLCFHDRHLILRTIFLSPLLQICTVLYFAEIVPVLLYVVPRQLQTADCRVLFPDFCSCSLHPCAGGSCQVSQTPQLLPCLALHRLALALLVLVLVLALPLCLCFRIPVSDTSCTEYMSARVAAARNSNFRTKSFRAAHFRSLVNGVDG